MSRGRILRWGQPFRDRPIRQKVLILIVLASVAGLLFSAAVLSVYDLVTFRRRALADATALVRVVSTSALPALVFDDSAAAREDLEALRDRAEIGTAAIYRSDGTEFARYTRPGGPAPLPTPPDSEIRRFFADRLILVAPLGDTAGPQLGWIRVQYMLPGLADRLPRYAIMAAVVLAALAAAAALLLTTLARSVSTPLRELAETARQLAATSDLRIRATRHADDEIGAVTTAFNRMLDTIEERDAALSGRARELRESEARLRLALTSATMETWVLPLAPDSDGRPAPDAAALAEFVATVHPEDRAAVGEEIGRAASRQTPLEVEFRTASAEGGERRMALRGHASADDSGRPCQLIGVTQDVTDQRRLEQQLLQSQKMEAIGNLAGGIAHDFNNLLTGMIGHLKFVQRALEPGSQVRTDIDEVERAARRAAALTSQLLSYARRQMVMPTVVDLNEVVRTVGPMLRRMLSETIDVRVELAARLSPVLVDAGQLEQVLVNLAVNARDAMPDGGRLTISTSERMVEAAVGGPELPGLYTELSVADTGRGIPPDIVTQIFEPFFTTKPVGQGTGLGLAMCEGIVRQADGHIVVESELGKGATIRIRLPAIQAETAARAGSRDAIGEAAGGTETILLAEDDDDIRDIAARALREAGYRVLEATDGASARRLAETPGEMFDLLVTDVVMPAESGHELAAGLRRTRPSLPVVFMSGYSSVGADGQDPADPFLPKPFTPDDLRRAARRALDAPRVVKS